MSQRVEILPAAEDDLDAAQRFYEEQAEGLGIYFLDALATDIESLLVHGGVHRMIHGYHRYLSKHFPYAIFYRLDGNTIFVYAVIDCRRNPADLHQRLRRL